MSALPELKEALARRFPDALPLVYRTAHAVATGIEALDRLLPNGGLPRGRLTVWRPGGGASAVLRATCGSVVRNGERAAWIDGTGVLAGVGERTDSLLIRPAGEVEALECAEELARCGGFALVVLGKSEPPGALAVRLSRAARAGGSALVVVTSDPSQAQLRVSSRLVAGHWEWRRGPFGEPVEAESARLRVDAWSLGWSGRTEFRLPVLGQGLRLAPDPLLVDRRGAPRRAVWPGARREAAG